MKWCLKWNSVKGKEHYDIIQFWYKHITNVIRENYVSPLKCIASIPFLNKCSHVLCRLTYWKMNIIRSVPFIDSADRYAISYIIKFKYYPGDGITEHVQTNKMIIIRKRTMILIHVLYLQHQLLGWNNLFLL